ncbi:hypothetical protein ACSFBX_22270 [Variovorax sp. RB2P76]|uniref:hypothetical protein n=1 Tax=Variovorax sp. RB2P76 TaxID=3443736 RepID=UPI003F446376
MKPYNDITRKLKRSSIQSKTHNDVELSSINFELFPIEVVDVWQAANAIEDYIVNIYRFAIDAQNEQMQIGTKQLGGVLLTHKKIQKFLASINVQDAFDIDDPLVYEFFRNYHEQQMKHSNGVLNILSTSKVAR